MLNVVTEPALITVALGRYRLILPETLNLTACCYDQRKDTERVNTTEQL